MIIDNNGIVYGNQKQIANATENINIVTEIKPSSQITVRFALDNLTTLT